MTSLFLFGGFTQQATYWQQNGVDGYGKRYFLTPTLISVRWEDATDLIVQKMGEEIPSKATVYTQQELTVGDFLALGNFTTQSDPFQLPENAFEILQFLSTPSVLGYNTLLRAIL